MRVLLLALVLLACGPSATTAEIFRETTVHGANAAKLAVEAAESGALALYRDEQKRAVLDVKGRGGTEDDARAAVAQIRDKWKPVWDALDAARAAHRAAHAAIVLFDAGQAVVEDIQRAAIALSQAQQAAAEAIEMARGSR
jgi:crotonobetainyl-CoA:carnitine CoA-transferase CaiB-like acyl-CoA transferase